MRSTWTLKLMLLLAATGCAMPGSKKPAAPPIPSQTSWTDKMVAPFKSLAPKKNTHSTAKVPQEIDPISLGFKSGPTTPALYVSMAQMSDHGGNPAHARSMYQKALSLDAKNLDASLGLARLEDREGNLQVALQHYQQAVNNHPQEARAYNDLGLCHARCGQMQSSLQCLDQAVRLRPDKALYRNNIAKVLIEANQFDGALAHLAAVNEPAVAHYNMAVLLEERGRVGEALPYLQQALAMQPQFPEATTLLANITGSSAPQGAMATGPRMAAPPATSPVHSAQIQVSAPLAGTASRATQVSANEDIRTAAPSVPSSPARYPSTGAPQIVPAPQSLPAHTALAPVGYEPALLPPIR